MKYTITLIARSKHWKDRLAGWARWRVTWQDGAKETVIGTRDDAHDCGMKRAHESVA